MFTLQAEAQEMKEGVYADFIKDENDLFACLNPNDSGRVFVVCICDLADAYAGDFSDESLERCCYKSFARYADFCSWFNTNVQN